MRWSVELVDLNQNVLSRLDNRKAGADVSMGLNVGRTASCPIGLDDPAVELVDALDTALRITADTWTDPVFIGRCFIPEEAGSDTDERLVIRAMDPMAQLDDQMIRQLSSVWTANDTLTYRNFSGDQSQIMADVIALVADSGHGIIAGALATASVARNLNYPLGKMSGEIIREMAAFENGVDFELTPVLKPDGNGGGVLAKLDTYYSQLGTDKSASIIFEYRHGKHTARNYSLKPAGDQCFNYKVMVGQGAQESPEWRPAVIAYHAASIAEHGRYEAYEERADVTDWGTLAALARSDVERNAHPINFFDFWPTTDESTVDNVPYVQELGQPPRFGKNLDYYLGDTITLSVQHPQDPDDESDPTRYSGRLTDAKMTEQENGSIDLRVACTPVATTGGVTVENKLAYIPTSGI